jgi:hypothetical protein
MSADALPPKRVAAGSQTVKPASRAAKAALPAPRGAQTVVRRTRRVPAAPERAMTPPPPPPVRAVHRAGQRADRARPSTQDATSKVANDVSKQIARAMAEQKRQLQASQAALDKRLLRLRTELLASRPPLPSSSALPAQSLAAAVPVAEARLAPDPLGSLRAENQRLEDELARRRAAESADRAQLSQLSRALESTKDELESTKTALEVVETELRRSKRRWERGRGARW